MYTPSVKKKAALKDVASFADALFRQTTMPDGSIIEGPTLIKK